VNDFSKTLGFYQSSEMSCIRLALFFSTIICLICFAEITEQKKIRQNNDRSKQNGNKKAVCKKNKTTQKFQWCLQNDYDKNSEPWKHGYFDYGPFNYDFEYEIVGIQEVNDVKETVKLEMYFGVKWKEPRIRIFERSFLEERDEPSKYSQKPPIRAGFAWGSDPYGMHTILSAAFTTGVAGADDCGIHSPSASAGSQAQNLGEGPPPGKEKGRRTEPRTGQGDMHRSLHSGRSDLAPAPTEDGSPTTTTAASCTAAGCTWTAMAAVLGKGRPKVRTREAQWSPVARECC